MPCTIGYFAEESKLKQARGSPGSLFSGAIMVPKNNEPSHFHKFLKDKVFSSKNVTLSSIHSPEEFEKKAGSLLELAFNNKMGDKWEQTNIHVKHGLEQVTWWTKSDLLAWAKERVLESAAQLTPQSDDTPKSVSKGDFDSGAESSTQQPSPQSDPQQTTSATMNEVPDYSNEETVATKNFNLAKYINIKLGPSGPLVTVTEDALQAWNIDEEEGDQAGMSVLLELSPALVRENLKLSDTVRDLKSQVDVLSRDLLSANTSNMDLRAKIEAGNTDLNVLRETVKKQEEDIKNKEEKIDNILVEIQKKVDGNTLALSSTRTDILESLGRVIDSRNRPREVNWRNPWPKAIASLKFTVQLYLTQETADALHSSTAFGEDMNAMIKADLIKTNILSCGSFKEFVLAIKNKSAVVQGPTLFFFEHEAGCTTGDSIMDKDAVATMKSSASRLISLTDDKHPSIFVSLPCEVEDLNFALKVEEEMKLVLDCVAMNTMVKEGTITSTPGNRLEARAFAEAIVILSRKNEVVLQDPCAQCKGFCQGEPCLLSADTQTIHDVDEEPLPSVNNNNKGFRISKRSTEDQQNVMPPGVNRKAVGPKFCWICGIPLSNHTPVGKPCSGYSLTNCKVCDGKGHKTSAHHVLGQAAQNAMRFKWGTDFEFVPFSASRKGNLKRKRENN